MFTFHEETDGPEQVRVRIRRIRGSRHAMHIGELRMRLGADWATVQPALAAMMEHGEVERLRPVGYPREDYDFFRLNRRDAMAVVFEDRGASSAAREGMDRARLARGAMACLAE
jgi:hypothetical protein